MVGYLTLGEAAKLARCHPNTIRRAIRTEGLRAFRPAHRVLLCEEDVRAWIEARNAWLEPSPSRVRPQSARRGRPTAPGSVAALRALDPELNR